MPLVFLYGTLMRSGANHDVLRQLGARFVGTASTRDRRTLVDLGPYPALLAAAPGDRDRSPVEGEVFELGDEALAVLDAFEGAPDLYRRDAIAVRLAPGGAEEEAFVYVLATAPPPDATVIASGRYTRPGTRLPDGAAPGPIAAPPRRR